MKVRVLLLFIILVAGMQSGFAQVLREAGLHFGTSLSSVTLNTEENVGNYMRETQPIAGVAAWGRLDFLQHKNLSITTRIGYLQKGGRAFHPLMKERLDYRLHYLSTLFGVSGRLHFQKISPYIEMGPRMDFLVSKKDEIYGFLNESAMSFGGWGAVGVRWNGEKWGIGIEGLRTFNLNVIHEYPAGAADSFLNGTLSDETYVINMSVLFKIRCDQIVLIE